MYVTNATVSGHGAGISAYAGARTRSYEAMPIPALPILQTTRPDPYQKQITKSCFSKHPGLA